MTGDVTVGVFCYRQREFLPSCLESIARQTRQPDRVVVVDDGSADGSAHAARTWLADSALGVMTEVLAGEDNRGIAARMNQVLAGVGTEFVLWVAADDMLVPRSLDVLLGAAEEDPSCSVYWGDLEVVDVTGRPLGYHRPRDTWQGHVARRYAAGGKPFPDLLRHNNFIPGGMTLVRTSALRDVGGYDEDVRTEDLAMWLLLGRVHRFRYTAETVGRYRVVPGSSSRRERESTLDQAALLSHHLDGSRQTQWLVARMLAMRWALSVGRTRGRPPVRLAEVAETAGLGRSVLVRTLPSAVWGPVGGSAAAYVRRRVAGCRARGHGAGDEGRQP